MSDKSGHSVLVALMKKNPLKGLSFHAAEANTDFCWVQGPFLFSFFFCFLSVFVSLLVILLPCEILSLLCLRILPRSLIVSFGFIFYVSTLIFTHCTFFAEGHQYQSRVDNLLRQGWNENTNLTINSLLGLRVCPASQFISIVDFYLLVAGVVLQ